ncbi:MAG: hypothetical protein LBS20_12260 [Prevotella sp.]|jgi:hypothetical protein|nr:hypothetical protein [Prevotella sp.]
MKSYRSIIALIVMLSTGISLYSQDLTKLTTVERDKKLIEIAKTIYKKKKFTNFYREYSTPKILELKTRKLTTAERRNIASDKNSVWEGSENNQVFYIVEFPYNMENERMSQNYAAQVYVWGNTGKAFAITLGNGLMYKLKYDGSEDIYDATTAPKTFDITYTGDVPNLASLPKKAKEGEVITLTLKDNKSIGYDGWWKWWHHEITKLEDGIIILDKKVNKTDRLVRILVTGPTKIGISYKYEEGEDPY